MARNVRDRVVRAFDDHSLVGQPMPVGGRRISGRMWDLRPDVQPRALLSLNSSSMKPEHPESVTPCRMRSWISPSPARSMNVTAARFRQRPLVGTCSSSQATSQLDDPGTDELAFELERQDRIARRRRLVRSSAWPAPPRTSAFHDEHAAARILHDRCQRDASGIFPPQIPANEQLETMAPRRR